MGGGGDGSAAPSWSMTAPRSLARSFRNGPAAGFAKPRSPGMHRRWEHSVSALPGRQTMLSSPAASPPEEPFWRAQTPPRVATPRGGSGGGVRPIRYMGWRPGEMEDTSHLKIGERRIDDAHGCPASRSSPPAGLEERAEMRRTKRRSQGYHGHIPNRFDKPVPQPGDRGDVKQGYVSHVPADSGHFDMPNTAKEPQVTDLGQRTIERTTSLRGRLFSPLKHLAEASDRASVSSLPLPAVCQQRGRVLGRRIVYCACFDRFLGLV